MVTQRHGRACGRNRAWLLWQGHLLGWHRLRTGRLIPGRRHIQPAWRGDGVPSRQSGRTRAGQADRATVKGRECRQQPDTDHPVSDRCAPGLGRLSRAGCQPLRMETLMGRPPDSAFLQGFSWDVRRLTAMSVSIYPL